MKGPRYPLLYEINTRVWLSALAQQPGRAATLDDIPDEELDRLAVTGFDWVWFLGIWQTGSAGRQVALSHAELRREYIQALPDFTDADVSGSCFAIQAYEVHRDFGGNAALARLRERLHRRNLRLMLDFAANHTAPDHRWVDANPEYYVHGTEVQLLVEPQNYARILTSRGPVILAYGRDPHFPGWSDTLQLNYGNPELQDAMAGELNAIAEMCDGLRCDMAMLLLPEVFQRTWGIQSEPFWAKAIGSVRSRHPEFVFMAEVYWDLEWAMQQQGFDYAYDKRLYDRLRGQHPGLIREHLRAGLDFQNRLARFLENHDEPRAAAVFPRPTHGAAAILSFLSPGLRFFHQGQLEGRRVRVPLQLRRGPVEPVDPEMQDFYGRLLECLRESVFRNGSWQPLECTPAWDGNWTWNSIVACAWRAETNQFRVVVINYAGHNSQCYLPLPLDGLRGASWRLQDMMSEAVFHRDGDSLASPGLYLDMPPWGYHVFQLTIDE